MNTSHFFTLRREEQQTTFADPEHAVPAERQGETGSLGLLRTVRAPSNDNPARYTQSSREQLGSDSETLTPVSIKLVQDAVAMQHEPVKINGNVMKHVTLVARVFGFDADATRTSFLLDDCTARIQAVYLTSSDQDAPGGNYAIQRRTRIREGLWIRVIGVICIMDGSYKISVIRMRPVEDYNEIVFHRLDTVKTYLAQTRGN